MGDFVVVIAVVHPDFIGETFVTPKLGRYASWAYKNSFTPSCGNRPAFNSSHKLFLCLLVRSKGPIVVGGLSGRGAGSYKDPDGT